MGTAFGVLVAALMLGCDMCGDENLIEVASPDNRLIASAFVRNCGATTDYVAHVQIRRNRRWFQEVETVFVAEGVTDPSVRWVTADNIEISCNGCPSLRSAVAARPDGPVRVTLVHRPLNP